MAERPQKIEQIERMHAAVPVVRQEMTCILGLLDRNAILRDSQGEVELQVAGLRAMVDFATFCLEGDGDMSSLLRSTRDRAEILAKRNFGDLYEDYNFESKDENLNRG